MIHDGDFTDEQLLLTTVQAAKVLGVGRTTIYELIKVGDIRPVHVARCCRISWAELERYVARLDDAAAGAQRDDAEVPPRVERRWRRYQTEDGRRRIVRAEVPTSDVGATA
jgi:excisionase family DNA binding protein